MSDLSRVAILGPLEGYAEGFAGELARQGYASSSVVFHVRLLAHVSRWLESRDLDVAALGPAAAEVFLAERRASGRSAALRIGSLEPLLGYLRGAGAVAGPGPLPPATAAGVVLARYARYLAAERGLAGRTITSKVELVRPYLEGLASDGQLDLGRLTAGEVTAFVVSQSQRRPGPVPGMVPALRSLLRFLHVGWLRRLHLPAG
jgi:integrase/recombinase XerD